MNARITSMENLIASDPGGRNVFGLAVPDQLRLAAQSLRLARRVGIVSGFYIPSASAGETDGPPGAIALGRALQQLGIVVEYITDRYNAPIFAALGLVPIIEPRALGDVTTPISPDELTQLVSIERCGRGRDAGAFSQIPKLKSEIAPAASSSGGASPPSAVDAINSAAELTHLVSVERCGRGRDGRYRNMHGDDITATTPPLDELFLHAPRHGITTIGIGDGGNEIGMGKVFAAALDCISHGREIASTVPADFCIAAGVSNWGAYGLVGALSVLAGCDLLPTPDQCIADIEACVRGGAIDGRSHRRGPTVDGLPAAASLRMLEEIRRLITPSPLESGRPLRVGIIGYGETGRAAANLLASQGHRVRISDLSSAPGKTGGTVCSVEGARPCSEPSRDREGVDAGPGRDHSATAGNEPGGTVCGTEGARPWDDPNSARRKASAFLPPLPRGDGSAHAEPGGSPFAHPITASRDQQVEAFEWGQHTLNFFSDCDLVIQSPGVRPDSPIIADLHRAGIPLMSELEMASQLCVRPIIAVTGSVGKRTTVELIQRLFAAQGQHLGIGGNRGLPLSTILASGTGSDASLPIALAVSSFQLESVVHFRPQIAIFLNIHEEFVDRHGSLAEYIRIKSRVFMNQHPDDILILPYDDERLRALARKHHGRTLFISSKREVERGAWIMGDSICMNVDGSIEKLSISRLIGVIVPWTEFVENLMAAVLAARLIGVLPKADDATAATLELRNKWAPLLIGQPETGMGYQVATVILKDGRRFSDVLIAGGIITEVAGHNDIPFKEEEIAEIVVTHGR